MKKILPFLIIAILLPSVFASFQEWSNAGNTTLNTTAVNMSGIQGSPWSTIDRSNTTYWQTGPTQVSGPNWISYQLRNNSLFNINQTQLMFFPSNAWANYTLLGSINSSSNGSPMTGLWTVLDTVTNNPATNITVQRNFSNNYAYVWYAFNLTGFPGNGGNGPLLNETQLYGDNAIQNLPPPVYYLLVQMFDEGTGLLLNTTNFSVQITIQNTTTYLTMYNGTSQTSFIYNGFVQNPINVFITAPTVFSRNYVLQPSLFTNNSNYLNYTLKAYFINSSKGTTTIFTLLDSLISTMTLQNVLCSQYTIVNSTLVNTDARYSDISGLIQFSYLNSTSYTFLCSATGYQNKSFTLNPILYPQYYIKMIGGSTINYATILSDGTWYFIPNSSILLPANQTFLFGVTANNTINFFGISYNGTTSNVSSNPNGGTANLSYDFSNVTTTTTATITYFLNSNDSNGTIYFYKTYTFYPYSNLSTNGTLMNLSGKYVGDLGQGGLIIIAVGAMVLIILALSVFIPGHFILPVVGVLALMASVIGFIPWVFSIMVALTVFFATWAGAR